MQLGTLLNKLQSEYSAAEALEAIGDIVLFTRVAEAAVRFDETAGEYVAASVGRFAATASDEAWLSLLSAMKQAPDPGNAALAKILDWAIREDEAPLNAPTTPGCGSEGCSCHDAT